MKRKLTALPLFIFGTLIFSMGMLEALTGKAVLTRSDTILYAAKSPVSFWIAVSAYFAGGIFLIIMGCYSLWQNRER